MHVRHMYATECLTLIFASRAQGKKAVGIVEAFGLTHLHQINSMCRHQVKDDGGHLLGCSWCHHPLCSKRATVTAYSYHEVLGKTVSVSHASYRCGTCS